MYGLLVIIRKGTWSCEYHPQIIFTLILHSKMYFKININLLLYEWKMHLSFLHPFSKQLMLFGVTGGLGPLPAHIGQDTPWTSHHFITKLRHIQTNKHIHTLPSSVAPPNDTHCLLNWESWRWVPPSSHLSLCLTKTNTWNRLGTRFFIFFHGWDGEDFQKCIKHQAIKYRLGGVKFTATLSAPQPLWPV